MPRQSRIFKTLQLEVALCLVSGMGLVWVGDRGTLSPPPHVSHGKIFLFSAKIEIKNVGLADSSQFI